jgi:hypothetical protein
LDLAKLTKFMPFFHDFAVHASENVPKPAMPVSFSEKQASTRIPTQPFPL